VHQAGCRQQNQNCQESSFPQALQPGRQTLNIVSIILAKYFPKLHFIVRRYSYLLKQIEQGKKPGVQHGIVN
jgi:hypothetical protein